MSAVPLFESAEPAAQARGRALGAARREQVAATWNGYERLFAAAGAPDEAWVREAGERALERIGAWAPSLADEIAGTAAGSGLEPWQLGALNARTELLAALGAFGRGECSTVVVVPQGGAAPPRTLQTWDWHDHLAGGSLACRLRLASGRTVRVFTEAGVVGKVGVNDAGLGSHINILGHAADGGAPGVPVHVVARRILDEAATLEEAFALASSAEVSASTVLSVATWDGSRAAARCFELSPAGVAEVAPRDGLLLHTNHFLDSALAAGETLGAGEDDTYRRLELLSARADALRAADSPSARAAALLSHADDDDGAALCCHPAADAPFDARWETLMTISLDVAAAQMTLHRGGPCTIGTGADGWQTV